MIQMNQFAEQDRHADIENGCVDMEGKGRWDELGD